MSLISKLTRSHGQGLIVMFAIILFCLVIICCSDDDDSSDPQPTPTATPTPIPNTPPDTSITNCPETVTTFPFSINYIGQDAEDAVELLTYATRMNGGNWSAWTSDTTATFNGLDNGEYIFDVKARDSEGLEDGSPASCQVTVSIYTDEEAPETWIVSGPSGIINVNEATFIYRGSDNDTAAEDLVYSWLLDNFSWSPYGPSTEVYLSDLSEGTHYFYVRARDEAGNIDQTPDSRSFEVLLSYYGIFMDPYSASMTVPAGSEAVFPVTATNTGSLTGSFTFSLSLQVPATWFANFCLSDGTCIVDSVTIPLTPGSSEEMTIHIMTDVASLAGTEGLVELQVVCQEDTSVIGYSFAKATIGF